MLLILGGGSVWAYFHFLKTPDQPVAEKTSGTDSDRAALRSTDAPSGGNEAGKEQRSEPEPGKDTAKTRELLLGKWKSVDLGGALTYEFGNDGTYAMTSPDGVKKGLKYRLIDEHAIDMESAGGQTNTMKLTVARDALELATGPGSPVNMTLRFKRPGPETEAPVPAKTGAPNPAAVDPLLLVGKWVQGPNSFDFTRDGKVVQVEAGVKIAATYKFVGPDTIEVQATSRALASFSGQYKISVNGAVCHVQSIGKQPEVVRDYQRTTPVATANSKPNTPAPKPNPKAPPAPPPPLGTASQWPKVMSVPTGKKLTVLEDRHFSSGDPVYALAIRHDGKALASSGKETHVWDLSQDPPKQWARLKEKAQALAFSPDGKLLAAGAADGSVHVLDVSGNKPEEHGVLKGHQKAVNALAFSPDGKLLAAGGEDKTVILWDMTVKPPTEKATLKTEGKISQIIRSLGFSANGRTLAASGHGSWHIWDVDSKKVLHGAMFSGKAQDLAAMPGAYAPDGKMLAFGMGNTIRLRFPEQVGPTLTGHTEKVTSLAFSPDSTLLASVAEDGNLFFWDFPSDKKRLIKDQGANWTMVVFPPLEASGKPAPDEYVACGNKGGFIQVLHLGYAPKETVAETEPGKPTPPVVDPAAQVEPKKPAPAAEMPVKGEEEAAERLRLAQRLLADSKTERGQQNGKLADQLQQRHKEGFQKLIQDYPKSKAAEEAKTLVDSLKD